MYYIRTFSVIKSLSLSSTIKSALFYFIDVPKLRHSDITFALTMVLHALAPISPAQNIATSKGASDSSVGGKSPNRTKMFLFHIGFVGEVFYILFKKLSTFYLSIQSNLAAKLI